MSESRVSTILAVAGPGDSPVLDQLIVLAQGGPAEVRVMVTQPATPTGLWTADAFAHYCRERLQRAGLDAEVSIADAHARSDAALARLVEAAAAGCDLVLVSNEGDGDRLPQRLVSRIRVSLLVEPAHQQRSGSAFRALVAVRDESDVEATVAAVTALHRRLPVEALVVHVPDLRPATRASILGSWEDGRGLVDRALALLEAEGIPGEGRVHRGSSDPPAALCEFAEAWDAAAVIVNSRRAGEWLARIAPSTARAIIRQATSGVLLTPAV